MKYPLTLFLCVLFLPVYAFATVKINEVAWMGTAASQYSEWIELYNDGDTAVSLEGWKLYKTANVLLYTLSKTIAANGYLLVERTTASAPDAVPGINDEAGTFGGGGLRNGGEDLSLVDDSGNVINVLPFASGWPAGDSKAKDTMQWDGTKWLTAVGTPDAQNATAAVDTDPTTSPVDTPAADPIPVVASTQTVTEAPAPAISTQPIVVASTTPVSTTSTGMVTAPAQVETPAVTVPVISAQPPVPAVMPVIKTAKVIAKKLVSATVASSSSNTSESAVDTVVPAPQNMDIQDPPAANKNNHIKIIIFGAVIFIGTALFLLLERFKAQQE